MSFQNRYKRYERRIDKYWAPVSIEVMLQEGVEEKISILKKAQQQAAKEMLHLEEASTFIEYIGRKINEIQGTKVNQNSGIPAEKIDWKGNQTQLAYVVQILLENGFIERGDHWKMCAEHFLVKGKPINNKKLAVAMGNVQQFNKDGKPKKAEILESIVSDISSLKK